jgi:hypothetical protein
VTTEKRAAITTAVVSGDESSIESTKEWNANDEVCQEKGEGAVKTVCAFFDIHGAVLQKGGNVCDGLFSVNVE